MVVKTIRPVTLTFLGWLVLNVIIPIGSKQLIQLSIFSYRFVRVEVFNLVN